MPDPSVGDNPIRIHTRRLTLEGVTPAAAADLSAGGTGGFGNGYASEALSVLAKWALARDDVRSLFATIEPSNIPSQAVIARAGFVRVSEELDEEGLQAYELRG